MGKVESAYRRCAALGALGAIGCALILGACQTSGGSFCSVAKPIRPTKETTQNLTDAEVAAILAHNRKGAALCGWKP